MKYSKKQFLEDVKHEATMLREHATKEEKGKLDFDTFAPTVVDRCIYGQMADECRTLRAIELINKCCIRFIKTGFSHTTGSIASHVNGETATKSELRHELVYSSIEAYIMMPNAQNANLISYIKGETDTLTL